MPKPRRKFDRKFKLRTVEKSYECESIADLAREMGLSPNLIYRWRAELSTHQDQSFPGEGKAVLSPEEAEKVLLRKRLREKEQELEILKKAIGIFSKSDRKYIDS